MIYSSIYLNYDHRGYSRGLNKSKILLTLLFIMEFSYIKEITGNFNKMINKINK